MPDICRNKVRGGEHVPILKPGSFLGYTAIFIHFFAGTKGTPPDVRWDGWTAQSGARQWPNSGSGPGPPHTTLSHNDRGSNTFNNFPVWPQNRLISAGLESVLYPKKI